MVDMTEKELIQDLDQEQVDPLEGKEEIKRRRG